MEKEKGNIGEFLDLGHTEAENHAKTQQRLYEEYVARTSSVTQLIEQFVKKNIFGWAWHYFKSRFGKRHAYQYYPVDGDTGIFKLQSTRAGSAVTLALLSDWANDTKESDEVAHLVAKYAPDYSLHLGDVYFVGAPKEIEENFTAPHASWYYGRSGSLTLSGNHEMYSNGNAFFQHLLPAMFAIEGEVKRTQHAGFFCLENDSWRIIGLDTGYTSVGRPVWEVLFPPDCHLREEQIKWLKNEVRLGDPADRRGIVFLSHHPVISGFRHAFEAPARQIAEIIGSSGKEVIWFWGHEHRLIGYRRLEVAEGLFVYGRCIGTGGMPVEIEMPEKQSDRENLAFYDRRLRARLGRFEIGYNGFVSLTVDGETLSATYRDANDTLILEEAWTVDRDSGRLAWSRGQHTPELSVY